MKLELKQPEIDHRTMRFLIGGIAFALAPVTGFLSIVRSAEPITSISQSYHVGGWPRDVFIGSLFAIAAFLLAYNGKTRLEMVLSKVAAVAAMGVALFPCRCDEHDEVIRYLHAASALVLFGILFVFCVMFRKRAKGKAHTEAKRRAWIYTLCAVGILVSVTAIVLDGLMGGAIRASIPRLIFLGEGVALVSFGIAWLTASTIVPILSSGEERASY